MTLKSFRTPWRFEILFNRADFLLQFRKNLKLRNRKIQLYFVGPILKHPPKHSQNKRTNCKKNTGKIVGFLLFLDSSIKPKLE
jgi:hypothetical protein